MVREERRAEAPRQQEIALENREKLRVTGVEEVLAFDDAVVVMRTSLGELTVRGQGLRVEELTSEGGTLRIQGRVEELSYREPAPGLWKRLFGG